jgi:staphylococcal nuclease domain-containing protein 1
MHSFSCVRLWDAAAKSGCPLRCRAQGVGPKLIVTLVDPDSSATIQSILLEAGLARLEKAGRGASKQKREALEALQEHQEVAKKERLNIWQYGDVGSDDEEEPRAWGRR